MQLMKRIDDESYLAFAKRVTEALQDGLIDYQEWGEAVLGENIYSEENTRRCAKFFIQFIQNLENDEIEQIDDKDRVAEIERAKEELIKERKKLQTVNAQAQEYYRSSARNELLIEQIKEAISGLEPISIKNIIHTKPSEKTAVLTIADAHYDSNYQVDGLFGECVNRYDKETFKTRMWSLLGKIEADDFDFDKLKVVSMGDCLEGLIRYTSLQKLKQPVVKSTIEFAEFMANWLVEASGRLGVPIDFAMVPGNHSVLRLLGQKPDFPEENLEYIIYEFIRLRLKDHKNIYIEPYNDVYFTTVFGQNLVFAHGEYRDLEEFMIYLENLYDITIDACYGAHFHAESSKSVGVGSFGSKRIIRVPSMVGTDPYAKSILKNNRAGAYFAIFSEDGEDLNKIYYLN